MWLNQGMEIERICQWDVFAIRNQNYHLSSASFVAISIKLNSIHPFFG